MITLRKLATLPPRTRLRKAARLLDEFEERLRRGREVERPYLRDLARMLAADHFEPGASIGSSGDRMDRVQAAGNSLAELLTEPASPETILRLANNLRHAVLTYLGEAPGEWDLRSPRDRDGGWVRDPALGAGASGTFPCPPGVSPRIYLEDIRSPFNVGAIFRSAEAFCVDRILVSPATPAPTSPRARRSSMGCVDRVFWEWCDLDALAEASRVSGLEVFALEIGGEPVESFGFPREGIVLVGNEELGLSPEARALAQGRICTIPMAGGKASLNVSVSAGILLHAWWSSSRGSE